MEDIKVVVIQAQSLPEDRKYRLREAFNILLSKPKRARIQTGKEPTSSTTKPQKIHSKRYKSKKKG